jgi:hypothetical protein
VVMNTHLGAFHICFQPCCLLRTRAPHAFIICAALFSQLPPPRQQQQHFLYFVSDFSSVGLRSECPCPSGSCRPAYLFDASKCLTAQMPTETPSYCPHLLPQRAGEDHSFLLIPQKVNQEMVEKGRKGVRFHHPTLPNSTTLLHFPTTKCL